MGARVQVLINGHGRFCFDKTLGPVLDSLTVYATL